MKQTATAFLLTTIFVALLASLSIAVQNKGYPHGLVGLSRLDGLANAATFIPLCAIYAFAAALTLLMPARPAGFVYANATSPAYFTSVVLLATIVGVQIARAAFGGMGSLRALVDWQFVFAIGIIVSYQFLDAFRRNILTRTIGLVLFVVAALACLYWNFKI